MSFEKIRKENSGQKVGVNPAKKKRELRAFKLKYFIIKKDKGAQGLKQA